MSSQQSVISYQLSVISYQLSVRDLRRNNIPARKSLCRRTRPARWYIIKAQVPYQLSVISG
ncbi:MAG: hypothetical protein IM509_12440 [Microcystis sp. M31BS1]|uniref:hypothetical protein n=1 Tax=Microcystis sp. M31BS1 TaxID=2771186 RepID=UPI0025876788|nr:hypothetical protein [Microcystis sp. M31BS1]MCA2591508.1 hypothetical protein [Microcystis sp. M31BS1]